MDNFYNIEGLEEFSAQVSDLTDTFKYLVACRIHNTNPEDAAKLTPELVDAFCDVASSFEDYIRAIDYYTVELELFQDYEKEGKAEEIRANYIEFTKEVAAELKNRLAAEAKRKYNI